MALWSTVATGFKLGLRTLEPVQLVTLGTLISLVIFWAVAAGSGRWRLAARELGPALALGVVNPLLYYLVLFEAYDRLPAQIAQPLNYTWAITLALLAVPVLGQRLSRRMLLGILASYGGVLVLLSQGRLTRVPDTDWLGVGLALGSTLLWASYWLVQTRAKAEPIATLTWSFSFAAPLLLALCWLGPGWPSPSFETLGYGMWVGAIEMGFTFLLWQRALRLTDHAGVIGQLIFLSPFLSLALIAFVLGEEIHLTSIVGLAIIVAGISLARSAPPAPDVERAHP